MEVIVVLAGSADLGGGAQRASGGVWRSPVCSPMAWSSPVAQRSGGRANGGAELSRRPHGVVKSWQSEAELGGNCFLGKGIRADGRPHYSIFYSTLAKHARALHRVEQLAEWLHG
jgi:hypothetical protein